MTNYIYWKWGKNNNLNIKSSRERNTTKDNTKVEDITEKKAPVIHEILKPLYDIPSDKRELASERISDRQLVIQTSINPFLADCDYLNDLKVQDTHLRPKDSNI
jgi:hypothetical protein